MMGQTQISTGLDSRDGNSGMWNPLGLGWPGRRSKTSKCKRKYNQWYCDS